MKYIISSSKVPKMATLGKGTECVKILLMQVSKACMNRRFDALPCTWRTRRRFGI